MKLFKSKNFKKGINILDRVDWGDRAASIANSIIDKQPKIWLSIDKDSGLLNSYAYDKPEYEEGFDLYIKVGANERSSDE